MELDQITKSFVCSKENNNESSNLWGALYFSPRQVSAKTFQLVGNQKLIRKGR